MPHPSPVVVAALVLLTLGAAASQLVTDNAVDFNDDQTMNVVFYSEDWVKSVPSQLQSLQSQMTNANREMSELRQTIGTLEAQIASQSASMERALKLLEHISESNEKLNSKVEDLQANFEPDLNKIDSKMEPPTTERSISTPLQSAVVETPQLTGLPESCAQALHYASPGAQSGVYTLHLPHSGLPPFAAYCLLDPKGGRGWTVVQRRIDGATDFYRGWQAYKEGFGDVRAEYFIGLDKLHAMTSTVPGQELWIQLEDFENTTRSARYSHFGIGDESEKYALNVLGGYMGDAGDSLDYHKGQRFSTVDSDNDARYYGNCAATFRGAWWYNDCHSSNLNGLYLPGQLRADQYAQAITWKSFRGELYGLKYAHMAIRPREATDPVMAKKRVLLSDFLPSQPSQGFSVAHIQKNPFLKHRT